jgi:hypothetical protein
MPAGRPASPAGAGTTAPVLHLRQTAEDEAALKLIAQQLGAGRLEAARHALRTEALRLGGPDLFAAALGEVMRRRAG